MRAMGDAFPFVARLEKMQAAARPLLFFGCLPEMEMAFSFIQNRAEPHPETVGIKP